MIFVYHEIVPEACPYLYSTTCQRFEEQLSFLADLDHTASLTFDDGHASHYFYARGLLAKYSIRATFFVTASWMDSLTGYMSWEQVRVLLAEGHNIQSHGWSHKMLTLCSEGELTEELSRSKFVLEDRLGTAVDSLSLPGGAANPRVLAACANTGYTRIYTSNPWSSRKHADGVEIFGRLSVRRTMVAADLDRLLRAESCPFAAPRVSHALRRGLRKAMGERFYHILWCALARQSVQDDIARSYANDQPALSK